MALATSCLPRVAQVSSSCGCTLTALSIKGLTPGELENLSNTEIDLYRVVLGASEAKMLGVQESGLPTLLRSSVQNIKEMLNPMKIGEQSLVLPYIQRPQRSIINAEYFTIEAGAVNANAGSTVDGIAYPVSAYDLTLNLGSSWLKTDLEAIERYFLPGCTLIVLTWDNTDDKNAKTLVFEIVTAVNADAGGVAKAKVTVKPNITDTAFAALDEADQAEYQPTFGVANVGANSVSDRESWCYNQPSDISRKLIVNWLQTSRDSRCIDSEYERILKAMLEGKVNGYQQGFKWNSIAEQNKQAAMHSDKAWVRSVFYGQRINENQTIEGYQSLPTVADPADPDCPLEYKANALGILTLLQECNRVVDNNGSALDLNYIFEQLYYLKRYRENDGDSISVIDSMTDRLTASNIRTAMTRYYQVKFNMTTTQHVNMGQKITHEGVCLFNYDTYDIIDQGCQWAVFWDTFFDDHIAAFPATVGGVDFKSRARMLWFLDWSDIKVGVAGTMSVTRKDPDPATNSLYKCVITAKVKTYNLRSTKWTVMVDRPHRHLIIQNFSGDCPLIDVATCPAPNPAS